jgi:nitronate monooxygenase
MALPPGLRGRLRLPAIAAPMFLVSGPELVLAACRAGIVGAFPANNARTIDVLEAWFARLNRELPASAPPWAVNIMVHRTYTRTQEEVALAIRHRAPIVITALGSPKAIVDQIHGYGGLVFADVNSIAHARKAAAAGVDGLVLVSAGAGGHTGMLSPFAFVPAVRAFFDGIVVLGGAGYKQMLIDSSAEDIVLSAALTGVPANWLKGSLIAAGLDPVAMPEKKPMDLGSPDGTAAKRWKDVWSAGHGVASVRAIEPAAAIIDQLVAEYDAAR